MVVAQAQALGTRQCRCHSPCRREAKNVEQGGRDGFGSTDPVTVGYRSVVGGRPQIRHVILEVLAAPLRRVRSFAWMHPRLGTALKTACAAGISWLLVRPVGGFVHDYPYYAPLGAVVAMSWTIAGSVRYSLQVVSAIVLGALLALAARAVAIQEILAIMLVIAVGALLGGWRRLGTMGSWVPVAALFVLIVGGTDPWRYVLAYGGLTGVGAAVSTVLNAALPQLPLGPAAQAERVLRREIVHQLEELARGLEAVEPLTGDEWDMFCDRLDPHARELHELVAVGMEARRGNWRAARRQDLAERRHDHARAFRSLTNCVEAVVALVSDPGVFLHEDHDDAAQLRAASAAALRATAGMVSADPDDTAEEDRTVAWKEADAAVAGLEAMASGMIAAAGRRYLPAGGVAANLRRAVQEWQ